MRCPRCGSEDERDVSKIPCSRCGLLVRMPQRSGSRPVVPPEGGSLPSSLTSLSSGMPSVRQQPDNVFPLPPTDTPMPAAPLTPFPKMPAESRSVPHRPQTSSSPTRSTEDLLADLQRPIRPAHLVTNPLSKEGQQFQFAQMSPSSTFPPSSSTTAPRSLPVLSPGTLLRGGRYRLRELQDRQDWLDGVFEATWVAQDAQRSSVRVMIRELVTPDSRSMEMQSMLRTATITLTSIGRNSRIPTLWDVFSDQGRSFFVFEPVDGESLLDRMRRTGRTISEQDVIECCLQMTDILEILSQQSPPVVHGLIRPEHIGIGRLSSDYILTNFSLILAGGARQFITGIDPSRLSAYTSPEFAQGIIDVRSDLYALLATAYHAVTGSIPTAVAGSIRQAQSLNPGVSSSFDQILAKGLRPLASQRYQRPSELRRDLLAMRYVDGTLSSRNDPLSVSQRLDRPSTIVSSLSTTPHDPAVAGDTVSQLLPNIMAPSVMDDQERDLRLPLPEELPPIEDRNDFRFALYWIIGILLVLIIVVILSRGFI